VTEFQKQFGLMSLHGYASVLALVAFFIHVIAFEYHRDKMMKARS
jgi:hypothetical protein